MTEMTLPRLVGSRKAARKIVESADGPFAGSIVVLNCRELRSAPQSFADEIVVATLIDGHAVSLTLKDASAEFEGYIRDAAARRGLPADSIASMRSSDLQF